MHTLIETTSGDLRVLLLENIHATAHSHFSTDPRVRLTLEKGAFSPEQLIERIKGVHVLGIRSKTHVTPEVIAAANELLAIGCFCIGTNQVALDAANAKGIPVFNAPFSNTRSVAELVIGELIMLTRHLPERAREMHEGRWKKMATGSHEVRGKTLGIVGYGHIGSQVGVLAEAFGMRVIYFDVSSRLPMGNNQSVDSLDAVLARSDFVTLHVPETPQTRMMIGATELARMKKGAHLINASRGSVVDVDALALALKEGHLAGAAVDVFPEEPATNDDAFESPLRGMPNVILTPHIAGSTEEAQAAIGKEVAASLLNLLRTGGTMGAVNFPQVELAPNPGTHRIVNVHRNVPGVLRDINRIVSDLNANIHAQVLSTDPHLGYLLMDLDADVSSKVGTAVAALPTNMHTRILS